MENEVPFAADAEIDVQLHATSITHSSTSSLTPTEDVSKNAVSVRVNEETPLLPRTEREDDDVPQWSDPNAADSRSWWRRPSVWWLLPFVFTFSLGIGGMAVPKINLILNLVCRDYLSEKAARDPNFTYLPIMFGDDNAECQIPEVQSLVAQFQLYLNLVTGICSALVSPRLGHLSDRYGRTRIIALTALASVLGEAVTVFVAARPERTSVNVLLIGALLDGLGGSFTTAVALVHSYASDCVPPEKRNVTFGYFHGALFTGVAAGPSLAAYIIRRTGSVLIVFCIAIAFHSSFFLVTMAVVPESLSEERQRIAREKHRAKRFSEEGSTKWLSLSNFNPMNLITPLSILLPPVGRPSVLFPSRRGASPSLRRNLIVLAAIDAAMFGVAMGTVQVIIIYAEYMFGWGNVESSIFVSIVNAVRVLNLFLILPTCTRIFRRPPAVQKSIPGSDMFDIIVIRLAILFDIVGYIGYALSRHGSAMVISGMIAAFGGMGSPTLQSSLTKHVPRDRTGQMLGAVGLLHALARVIAPAVFSLIYSFTVGKFTQAVFVCLVSGFCLAFLLSLSIRPNAGLDETMDDLEDEEHTHLHPSM
ncbi:hypothetical protein MPDQ_007752 [Monascus purpureus]|uniref:Major facilitator superfamily (MFS) profile domain-containing protein n=1 Tax=Monascus purpureus TaxID=5098 RepID=A0A507QRL5_MONPU|nr:hypothetical protein MPDQ_007752 [Monascus purpureus]BDD58649.1 hypothetical protein MAP00_003911 [Monascus purpureus]